MGLNKHIRIAGRIAVFCARHGLAVAVTVAAACVLWTAAYIALLLWAVLTDSGIGGPLAYPAGLLFFFVAAAVASCVLFFPCTALAEWFVRRRGLPIFAQIPISVVLLALPCLVAAGMGLHPDPLIVFGVFYLPLLVPFGIYWWVAQSLPLFLVLIQRLRRRLLT